MVRQILVVDDDKASAKILEARLTARDFEVLVAHNGPDALKIVAEERLNMILLDVMMPGMDGFEVCRRVKDNPANKHIPVIMVTALDRLSHKIASIEAGAADLLTKPVNDVDLMAKVYSLIQLG